MGYRFNNAITKLYDNTTYNYNKNIANITHDNIMLPDDDLFKMLKHIMPYQRVIKELLIHEFIVYEPSIKIKTAKKLLLYLKRILNRYKIIWFDIFEDDEWDDVDKHYFKTKKNQKVLFNTISNEMIDDDKLIWFLDNLVKYIRKTSDIKFRYKIVRDNDHMIAWILLIIN